MIERGSSSAADSAGSFKPYSDSPASQPQPNVPCHAMPCNPVFRLISFRKYPNLGGANAPTINAISN